MTENETPSADPRSPLVSGSGRVIVIGLAIAIAVAFGAYKLIHKNSSSLDPTALAQQIGAVSCSPEAYQIINRLDGSKAQLFDCDMGSKTICVTVQNGIARDVTAEARLLWQGALGGAMPMCLSG